MIDNEGSMKRFWYSALVLGLLVVAAPVQAHASETDALLNKLIEKGILTNEEAQEVRNEMAKDSGSRASANEADVKDIVKKMPGGSWLNTVKWGGDLRVRHETQFRTPAVDRSRERFRLRFGFTANPVKPLEIGVRLASGASGDPLSTNQSFGATFDKKAIFIDKAYAKYTPWSWVNLIGGKMDIPFEEPSEGMVFDSDVTPEGVAMQLKSPEAIPWLKQWLPVTPFMNMGAFQVSELSGDDGDPGLFGYQAGANIDLPFFGMTFQPSAAYYNFTAIDARNTADVTGAPAGNTTVTKGGATYFFGDYDLVSVLGKLTIPDVLGQPVTILGNYVVNTKNHGKTSTVTGGDTDIDNTAASLVGAEIGKVTEKFGSWKTFYYYKHVENDAVFGALTDSDFGGGGTNHEGHILGLQFGLNKWASLGVKYFSTRQVNGTKNRVDTLQLDCQTKF